MRIHSPLCGSTSLAVRHHSYRSAEGGERSTPYQAALKIMGMISNFMKNIGEDERWSGRTQSGASWSPEQLRRDLRLQLETVKVEDQSDGILPICQEISTHAESSVRVMMRSGSRSS